MKIRGILATGLVLLLGGTLPASAEMMGGGTGMMGTMDMMGRGMHEPAVTGCPGMPGQPVAFGSERPWISSALAHAKELGLSPDQVKGLTALRDEFQKEALRLTDAIRAAEADLRVLYGPKPLNLQAMEAKIRAVAGLEADLRVGRVKTLEKGNALLTPEQQEKLGGIAQSKGWGHGASMMSGAPEVIR
ncbi:MAG: Spy/CpxP family protein refolding chaperone [candidate division NC10 bacterium]|nr:Spy/CpxP family protein refolding chaperone [candidate division NC10 bacterium]